MGHALAVNGIAIVGPVASGKTTLAARLGSSLGLPVFDVDDYYWRSSPLPSNEEWVAKHSELISRDGWIISRDYRGVANVSFRSGHGLCPTALDLRDELAQRISSSRRLHA